MGQRAEQPLTPYQGKRRAMGQFCCSNCSKEWTSASTWANTSQICLDCGNEVYPWRQWKHRKKIHPNRDPKKKHLTKLCGMCRKLGKSCIKVSDPRLSKTESSKKNN